MNLKSKLALCSGDIPGIITSDERLPSRFTKGETYVPGVNLLTGEAWGSSNPLILGTFAEFLGSGLSFVEWVMRRREGRYTTPDGLTGDYLADIEEDLSGHHWLLQLLEAVQIQQEAVAKERESMTGILCQEDEDAIKYQRLERARRKLLNWINRRLQGGHV